MAVESAEIGTWDFDPITGKRNWSERAKIMFGLTPGSDVNKVLYLDRVHQDDRDRVRVAVESALNPPGAAAMKLNVASRCHRRGSAGSWSRGRRFSPGKGRRGILSALSER